MKSPFVKITRRGAVIFFFILTIFFSSKVTIAIAGDYMGEFCWSLLKTEDENGPTVEGPFIVSIGVSHTGGSYYILQGIIEVPDDNPFILDGTAIIIGNEVFITMDGSQDHSPDPWRDTGTMQVRLDATSLDGTFWQNRLDFDTSTRQFDQGYAAGTATFTACP